MKILSLLFGLLLISACANNEVKIPDNVLSQDEMAEVIKDIQLLEAVHKDIGLFGVKKKELTDTSYAIVFNKHKIKASEFDSSYRFYTAYPALFSKIMDKVEEDLNKEE